VLVVELLAKRPFLRMETSSVKMDKNNPTKKIINNLDWIEVAR
jgi:hypothetical protein